MEEVLKYMMEKLTNLEAGTSKATSVVTIRKVKYEERQTQNGKHINIKEHLNNEDDPYTPRVVSIGPLHRGKEEFEKMEEVKWRYLKKLLDKGGKDDLAKYLEAATSKEKEAERYFPGGVFKKLDDKEENDTFSVMLVLDGCFLMEFLRKSIQPSSHGSVLSDFGWRLPWIKHDILLFENQIPFFVLEALYEVFKEVNSSPTNIKDLTIDYLYNTELLDQNRNFWAFYADKVPLNGKNIGDPSHLLHLYHTIAVETQHKPPSTSRIMGNIKFLLYLIMLWIKFCLSIPLIYVYTLVMVKPTLYPTKISATATELEEAGVKFQGSFMDLRFRKGTLFIPVFSLNYHSFSLLKNLIALEYYHPQPIRQYIYCYAEFLSELIESSSDLEILNNLDIIMVQNKEAGTDLIRKLLTQTELRGEMMENNSSGYCQYPWDLQKEKIKYWENPRHRYGRKLIDKLMMHLKRNDNFGYWQNSVERKNEILKYCENPRHRWGRKLMKDYFDSPWSILGVLVALILLVETTLQTIYTMLK